VIWLRQNGCPLVLLVLVLWVPATPSDRAQESGTLIEAVEFDPCHYDCAPFTRPSLIYCVQSGDRILIGARKASWRRTSSDMFEFQGKPISVRQDNGSLWIVRPDQTEMRLSRGYKVDVFHNPVCTAEIHRQWLAHIGSIPRPSNVPSQATLIPESDHSYFWVSCTFVPASNWDACSVWDSAGAKYAVREVVNQRDRRAVLEPDLQIDPLTTTNDYEFRLKSGVTLADWAKSRVNNIPSPDSPPPLPPDATSRPRD